MKIAIIIYSFMPHKGGVESVVRNHVTSLLARGHEIHLYTHESDSTFTHELLTVHLVPATTWYAALKHLSFAHNVKLMIQRDEPYDIIHSYTRTYYQDIYRIGGGTHREYLNQMQRYAKAPGLRSVINTLNPKERAILSLERRSFDPQSFRLVTSVSERTKQEIMEHYQVPENRIRVIYNGVNIDQFQPDHQDQYRSSIRSELGYTDDDVVVMYCGTGFRRKGLDTAIEAVARVQHRDHLKLLVVGEGNITYYQRLAERCGVARQVIFAGKRTDVSQLYGASDVLIHPTRYDPFPNVCMEALASGLPVITTRVAGVSEILTHTVDSYILERVNDPEDAAHALEIFMDTSRRVAAGREARRKAEEYPVERCVNRNIEVYQEILDMKGSMV